MVKVWVSLKTIVWILGYGGLPSQQPKLYESSPSGTYSNFRFNRSGVYKSSECSEQSIKPLIQLSHVMPLDQSQVAKIDQPISSAQRNQPTRYILPLFLFFFY